MAVRQSYNPDVNNNEDPAGVYDQSMFPAPAMSLDGGNQGQGTPSSPSTSWPDTGTGLNFPIYTSSPSATPVPSSALASSPFTGGSTTGTPLNVDAQGNVYDQNGKPMTNASGQPVSWGQGATGSYVPPPPVPAAPAPRPAANSPLGDSVSGGLQNLIGHEGITSDQQQLLDRVNAIIASGGHLSADDQIEAAQLEKAREQESQAFGSQLRDARGELSARGLVGEPGSPQGLEGESIQEISRNLAPQYATAVRDITTGQQQIQEQRLQSAISTATGLDNNAASNLLSALGQGTQRQLGLSQIALDSLQQDQNWNMFLANYGLNRDQIMQQIQSGNTNSLMTLINLFLQIAGQSAKGHV